MRSPQSTSFFFFTFKLYRRGKKESACQWNPKQYNSAKWITTTLTWYSGKPLMLWSTMVISGAEKVHVHRMILVSVVEGGLSGVEVSSRSTILFFFEKWRRNNGFNLFIIMLHWVPPSFRSISALIGEVGWKRENLISQMRWWPHHKCSAYSLFFHFMCISKCISYIHYILNMHGIYNHHWAKTPNLHIRREH